MGTPCQIRRPDSESTDDMWYDMIWNAETQYISNLYHNSQFESTFMLRHSQNLADTNAKKNTSDLKE